jgi:aspartate-semialdehyde dehydrogenase
MKTVAILGAHRAVAKALVEVIEERELPIELLRATTTDHLEPELILIDEQVVARADLFVLCMGGPLIEALIARAKKPILDLANASEAPLIFPGLDAEEIGRAARIPIGLAVPLVSALRPLAAFGLQSAAITTLESAAAQDREGMDELSEQVRALFSMRDAEPKSFPATLAFNVIPLAEPPLAAEVAEGLARTNLRPELRVSRALVPTFSAESAFVEAVVDDPSPSLETVLDGFRHARGLSYARDELSAVDALGRDDALVGMVRAAPRRIAFYLAVDRLRRGSATLAALALERWISV